MGKTLKQWLLEMGMPKYTRVKREEKENIIMNPRYTKYTQQKLKLWLKIITTNKQNMHSMH